MSIDLNKMKEMLDKALDKETTESLRQFLLENRFKRLIIDKQDAFFKEALKKKGYEFENHYDFVRFVLKFCTSEYNVETEETTFFVKGVPFIKHRYNFDFDFKEFSETETSISITTNFCNFTFL